MKTSRLIYLLISIMLLTGCNGERLFKASQKTITSTAPPLVATTPLPRPSPTAIVPFTAPTIPIATATEIQVTETPAPNLLPLIGSGSSFAYDRDKGEVLVFGGSLSRSVNPSDGTWAWDGHTWKQYQPQNVPPARIEAAMVYDSARKQTVLFGGAPNDGRYFNDMWSWDGENWTEIKPPQMPSPRAGALMVYDDARDEIFLFGGYFFNDVFQLIYLNETWTFDGQTWTKHNPAHSPHYGDGTPMPIMTYDAARKQPVLLEFGIGFWTWNGNDWSQLTIEGEEPIDIQGQLGYDEKSQRVVLWGTDMLKGAGTGFSPETWLFDGQTWTPAREKEHGPDSVRVTILYDSKRQRLLMFTFVGSDYPTIFEWGENGWQQVNKSLVPTIFVGTPSSPLRGASHPV